jgi:threonine/homoserine/homoserine lactone efflux protein
MFSATVVGSHRHGFWFGPRVIVGHALCEAVMIGLLLVGLATFLSNSRVLIGIGTVGGATMIWMGLSLMGQARRYSSGLRLPPVEDPAAAGALRFGATTTGIVTSVLNPYWYLWWVAVAPPLVAMAKGAGWLGVGAFATGHISADMLWYSLTSLGVSSGRRLLQGRAYQVLLVVCGLILLAMAGLFLAFAAEKFWGLLYPVPPEGA